LDQTTPVPDNNAANSSLPSFTEFLQAGAVTKEAIDSSLRGRTRWKLDPVLGTVERDYEVPGGGIPLVPGGFHLPAGIDGSAIVVTIQPNGARTAFMYRDKTPRINTYGDSFTHCDQVNDGETWQEYLAGHLREPIRNFGTGGHGVYQAYLRMLREEATEHAAKYLIFYIWGDDSYRTLMRGVQLHPGMAQAGKGVWTITKAAVEMDLKSGHIIEKPNLLPTEASMYQLTDARWIVEHFKDDLALQLVLYGGYPSATERRAQIRALDREKISQLAACLNFTFDWSANSDLHAEARALLDRYAQRATLFILDKAREFASQNGKKLLIVLNDPYRALPQMIRGEPRYDQGLADYLVKEKMDYFDMNEVHLADFRASHLSYEDYTKRYFVGGDGHYNPQGNHFFAYSIKGKVVDWLDPKPATYQHRASATKDSRDYLFNGRFGTPKPGHDSDGTQSNR
jgi:hypothetical protein